jgi:hypothetical protein
MILVEFEEMEKPLGYYIIFVVILFFLFVMYATGLLGKFINVVMGD